MNGDPRTEIFITEFINVSETSHPNSKWCKLWGMLIGGTLTLSESKSSERPVNVIQVRDVEIQPAVKETGKILAFKLVDKGKTLIVLEPLSITDMGRWVSSLFAAIQGIANYELSNVKPEKRSKTSEWENNTERQGASHRHSSGSGSSEPQDVRFTVKVRDIAKIYESLTSASQASKSTVRRSLSSPNIASKSPAASPVVTHKPFVVEVITKTDVKLEEVEVKLEEKPPESVKQLSQSNVRIQSNKTSIPSEKFKSHQGAYLAQESEKEVLANLMNPQLAQKRYQKQKQIIERLEVTMKSVIEKVKRQKKSLEETDAAIKELESQSTTPEDYNDVAKLQDQKIKLQNNISQSEASIVEYKTHISTAEEELRQLSRVIAADNETISTTKSHESTMVTEHIQVRVNHVDESQEKRHHTSPAPAAAHQSKSSSSDRTTNKDEPEWISKARQKSEAIKRLAEEGMLD